MISKGFVAFAVMALAVAPSLMANPIIPGEPATNSTMTPITANTGHSSVPPSSSAAVGSTSATSPTAQALEKPVVHDEAGTNVTSVTHAPASPTTPSSVGNATVNTAANATSVAHSPAPSSNLSSGAIPPLNRSSTTTPLPATNASSTPGAHLPNPGNNTHDAITPPLKQEPSTEPQLARIPSCFDKKKSNGVQTHHCEKALDRVVYAANQTLDKFSGLIFANYKTCNINIHKPNNATLTKVQVASMVRNITEACHSVGGILFKNSKMAVTVERGNAKNTYEVGKSICRKEECPLTQGDCLSAFYQIDFDHKRKNCTHSLSRVTSGNCTVTISTTDYSKLDISRENVYPTMKKLFNECGRHPGKIYLFGGSTGLNGNIKISTRPSHGELCN